MRTISAIAIFLLPIFLSCQNKGEQEIYLIPKDYTGHILVILNQNDGEPIRYEDDARVYEIPETGVLKTQFSKNEDWIELPKFYYDEIDEKNRIPVQVEYESLSLDRANATLITTGVAYKNINGMDEVLFVEFYVGTKDQIYQASQRAEKLNIIDLLGKE